MSKKAVLNLILIFFMIIIFEVAGFLSWYVDEDMYDNREAVLAAVEKMTLAEKERKWIDPVLGWKSFGPRETDDCNCQGASIIYAFDSRGTRTYNGYDGNLAEIIVVGDSYSHGYEVPAEDMYSAQLAELLKVHTANHAYGGYGPVQAFLTLEQNIRYYPKAKIAILGIMYENIFRMVNSYRPILHEDNSKYAMKPFMKQGEMQPHPGLDAFKDVDTFKRHVNDVFDNDFWARPEHSFPFSVSFIRAMGTDFFYFKKVPRKLRKFGLSEFTLAYGSQTFAQELIPLLDLYGELAKRHHLVPVVLFIPRDKYDIKSASRFVSENKERLSKNLLIGDVGTANIDWEKYNLLDTKEAGNIRFCHPSPYGHQKIAEYIVEFLKNRKGWPSQSTGSTVSELQP